MPRGGRNSNTFKPLYNAGPTCTIRVPESKKEEIKAIIRALDTINYNGAIVVKDDFESAIQLLKETLRLPRNNASGYARNIAKVLELLGEPIDPSKYGINRTPRHL